MDNFKPFLKIPTGVKDTLPKEAWQKRLLENNLADLFHQWGYQEVATPTFEFYELLKEAGNPVEQLFNFIDREGHILALRPDLTTPIARLVATYLRNSLLPLRLFYTGSTYRYESIQTGRLREFSQAGVELIGSQGVGADAEVIALAIEALLACKLQFKIGIGQVLVTKGLIAQVVQDPSIFNQVKQAIIAKDFVELENILDQHGCSREESFKLLELASLHGGKEVLTKALTLSEDLDVIGALKSLEEVYQILEKIGLASYVFFDFSILRDFEYYTGIVFEGYASGLGYPVCGGGRYDGLLSKFGLNYPATGFALGLERVMLTQSSGIDSPQIDFLLTGSDYGTLLHKAKELRSQGYSVEVDLQQLDQVQLEKYAREKEIKQILELNGEE
ncbi:ATP phosphoribosyltransferase regulatory subunit [Bacillota bacterium LX-D]|nr:ATP phosphoribosyltransferase regulatory subunit [Bacillota bacterium LX-D]